MMRAVDEKYKQSMNKDILEEKLFLNWKQHNNEIAKFRIRRILKRKIRRILKRKITKFEDIFRI